MAQRPGELAGIELYDSGVGFAVPGWRAREIADDLASGKSFYRGWLGMQVDPRVQHGVRILRNADPSPLREVGAQAGDYIVAINDQPIKHFGQLVKAIYMLPAGSHVRVRLLREAEHIDVDVILARSEELGDLPPEKEPFDPAQPAPAETPVPESPND
jgi:S1-C subfamily serine protease